jgi:uncharacterized protein (TIGR02246 family)
MRKRILIGVVCVAASALAGVGQEKAKQSNRAQDEAAIRAIIQEEITSWNAGDAKVYSQHFAEDGTFTNVRGEFYRGHKEYLDRHEVIFRGMFKGSKLTQEIVSLRFVRPDVAIVETLTEVTGYKDLRLGTSADSSGKLRTRLMQVMTKQAGAWTIQTYHNTDIKTPPAK